MRPTTLLKQPDNALALCNTCGGEVTSAEVSYIDGDEYRSADGSICMRGPDTALYRIEPCGHDGGFTYGLDPDAVRLAALDAADEQLLAEYTP